MKYLEKIILKNFQSHNYTELDLSRGVNVIVGPSDSGKTAIMRAIRWNLFNEPSGVDFIREGESEVSVTVRFQDGIEITRLRGKSKNQYILRQPEEDEVIFEGFGTHVPQEIRETTGIYKVMLDDKKSLPLNFSDQLEGPFLLQETDAYKAQAIGRMVGVDVLDETMRNTLRDKKQLSTQKDLVVSEIEETEKSLEAFQSLDEKLERRDKLIFHLEKLKDLEKRSDEAKRYLDELRHINTERSKVIGVLDEYAHLDEMKDRLLSLENKAGRYYRDSMLLESYLRNRRECESTKGIIASLGDGEKLDEIFYSIGLNSERLMQINPLYQIYLSLQKELNSKRETVSRLSSIDKFQGRQLISRYDTYKRYNELFLHYRELHERLSRGCEFMEQFNTSDEAGDLLQTAEKNGERAQELKELYASYKGLLEEKEKRKKTLVEAQLQTQEAMDAYMSALSQAGTCPICRQPIDEDHLSAIKESLED